MILRIERRLSNQGEIIVMTIISSYLRFTLACALISISIGDDQHNRTSVYGGVGGGAP